MFQRVKIWVVSVMHKKMAGVYKFSQYIHFLNMSCTLGISKAVSCILNSAGPRAVSQNRSNYCGILRLRKLGNPASSCEGLQGFKEASCSSYSQACAGLPSDGYNERLVSSYCASIFIKAGISPLRSRE